MAKVSIGLPVYNGENYVAESVESILSQTYRDFELIISDNASTDGTPDICQAFAARDSRVRYFRQPRNLGAALNSNFVFHQAQGQYFKWISHDDLHAPTFVERCVQALEANPSAVICCPAGILIDEFGQEIVIRERNGWHYYVTASGEELEIRPYDKPKRLESPDPAVRFHDVVLYMSWCLEIFGLARTEVLRRTGLHGAYHGTDKRIMAELALLGPFKLLDETLLFYRQHPVQAKLYNAATQVRDQYLAGSTQKKKPVIPRLNNLRGFLQAVWNAPVSWHDRVLCYVAIAQWLIRPHKWGPLMGEALRNARIAARGNNRRNRAVEVR